jgi:hypothetical protein
MRYWSQEYAEFDSMRKALKNIKTKKELETLSADHQYLYNYFRNEFSIDKRLGPVRTYQEFIKYKQTGLWFKEKKLNYPGLRMLRAFRIKYSKLKYKSDKSIGSIVTDALCKSNTELMYISVGNKKIDIAYKRRRTRTVVHIIPWTFDMSFVKHLPPNYMVNVLGSAYNKSGYGFERDYITFSKGFKENLWPKIDELGIAIYRY